MAVKTLRERQREETRQLLVAVARELFTERGYGGTSIEDIIQRAGVARGALYHHFDSKDVLFRAVYEQVQDETMAAVSAAALAAATNPWAAVRAGLAAFLDACLDPAFRQIVVLDSVSVVQSRTWEGGLELVELPVLRTVLAPLVAEHLLPGVAVEPLVYIALGGLYGSALYIARAPEPATARSEANAVLDALVEGVRRAIG